MTIKVMPEGFSPRRQGKRPMYDVSLIAAEAAAAKPNWVAIDLDRAHARSAKNQLIKLGYDVSVENSSDTTATLYARATEN